MFTNYGIYCKNSDESERERERDFNIFFLRFLKKPKKKTKHNLSVYVLNLI